MPEAPIAIVGAGPLGLAAALRLRRDGHAVRVFDARPADAPRRDARILALSHGSRQLLEQLGAWPAAHATSIETIHVSQRGALGRTLITAAEQGVPALGYVVGAEAVTGALLTQTAAARISIEYGSKVESVRHHDNVVTLTIRCGDTLDEVVAPLAACCEGAIGEAGKEGEAGAVRSHDYGQHALLLRAVPADAHRHIAYERFTSQGPIALLPFGRDYAVVWTVSPARLAELDALDDLALCAALQAAFGRKLALRSVGGRASYPLGLRFRTQPAQARVVWLGNAAQTLHPVAGQGFNLALRDVWELADTLREAADPGDAALLQRYARHRRADRFGAIAFTDGLVRLFSSDNALLSHLRGAGLLALDTLPPLRHFLARRMIFGARAWP